jgi:PleD family two-component response regulator
MSYPQLVQEVENSVLEASNTVSLVKAVTVLVVDDHALIRAAISQVLSSQPDIDLVAAAQNYS